MARPQILIVDDNPDNLLALEAILCNLPASSQSMRSGDAALLALLRDDFAVVLLDVNMPDLDGFETARLIRSRDRTRHLPIIFLTAYSRSETNVAEAYALGAVDFIQKPIMPEALRAKVSVFLDLWNKVEESKRQQELLRRSEQNEHMRKLERARQEFEKKLFEEEVLRERRISEALNRANERLQFLSEAATRLLLDSPEPNISSILARLSAQFDLDMQLEYALDEARDELCLRAQVGIDEPVPEPLLHVSIIGNVIGRVARERTRWVLVDPAMRPDLDDPIELCTGGSTIACFPIAGSGRLHRVVVLAVKKRRTLAADEIASIQLLCDQMAAALDRARLVTELEEAHQRKDEFLAMLGHELRNPLAPIMNSLELFRRRVGKDDISLRALAASERQVRHIVRLVDDLLDVSRITRGKVALKRERIDIATVVDQVLHACAYIIEERGHTLTVSLPEEPIFVDADPNRIAQVLANLLHNAAKYTEPKGLISLTAAVEGKMVALCVQDNGIGIPESMLDKIFDVFVQIEPTADRSRGGLGLGLSLVKHLIEMHEGSVEVKSRGPGQGSEFTVRIPLAPKLPELQLVPAPEAEPVLPVPRGLKIVLIEDNVDIRETLRDILEMHGHQVSVAFDGKSGVDRVLADRPQIALIDIGLPGFDGYHVADAIRASEIGRDVRLVALTGYGAHGDRLRALAAGFDEHVVKPIAPDRLEETLSRLIDKPRNKGIRNDANADQQR